MTKENGNKATCGKIKIRDLKLRACEGEPAVHSSTISVSFLLLDRIGIAYVLSWHKSTFSTCDWGVYLTSHAGRPLVPFLANARIDIR